jgi:5-methylthioadenosine/S-adenosylhomocysteine deaminase
MSEYALSPVDPASGPTFALGGRVVQMTGPDAVLEDGVVYVRDGSIAAVSEAGAPAPEGFEGIRVLASRGTIYPGLIDLHDHLSYNALELWQVPKRYTNRDQWAKGDTYRKLVTGPMQVLAHTKEYVEAVVRYVEAKCLVAGTTTTQGIGLSSAPGIQRYYRGIVRNVEQTGDPALPQAGSHIADVEASDRDKFLARLRKEKCLLLHLSEGTDDAARKHFQALQSPSGEWAVTDSLAGIHCVALQPADFEVLAQAGASMVWSPLSNLLLYGETADVAASRTAGVAIALGPDWSPSGSKNLLGELKLARLVAQVQSLGLSDFELLAMATRDAAAVLRWQQALGTLEAGRRADLLVVSGRDGDPHGHLFTRSERDVELVVINGFPRYGSKTMMQHLLGSAASEAESATIAGRSRLLDLRQATADPDVGEIPLGRAKELLTDALERLPELAKDMVDQPKLAALGEAGVSLVLDHEEGLDFDLRPHLPGPDGEPTAEPQLAPAARATPLENLLVPLTLDPLTVVDDGAFVETLTKERNLPKEVAAGIGGCF